MVDAVCGGKAGERALKAPSAGKAALASFVTAVTALGSALQRREPYATIGLLRAGAGSGSGKLAAVVQGIWVHRSCQALAMRRTLIGHASQPGAPRSRDLATPELGTVGDLWARSSTMARMVATVGTTTPLRQATSVPEQVMCWVFDTAAGSELTPGQNVLRAGDRLRSCAAWAAGSRWWRDPATSPLPHADLTRLLAPFDTVNGVPGLLVECMQRVADIDAEPDTSRRRADGTPNVDRDWRSIFGD